ncbi:hypothetical protein [Rhodoferax sp.]|uniref:hypothetical protein n=1 Tax=Rhodoferax sp. TaxID=50421 RepID=UPI00374DCFB6
MPSTTTSEFPPRFRSAVERIATPAVLAVSTALLMSLLIGLLWSLWWTLGAALVLACFHTALGMVHPHWFKRVGGTVIVCGMVVLAGYMFGAVAAASASFVLLLPLGLASLGVEDDELLNAV